MQAIEKLASEMVLRYLNNPAGMPSGSRTSRRFDADQAIEAIVANHTGQRVVVVTTPAPSTPTSA
jgi:hypothetical protein